MRKASREMDAAFALEVLDKAPYVTVSMIKSDGSPYGLPLSLVRTDEKTFYFHCALEGDKQQSMECFCFHIDKYQHQQKMQPFLAAFKRYLCQLLSSFPYSLLSDSMPLVSLTSPCRSIMSRAA